MSVFCEPLCISDVRDELGWPTVSRLHKQHSLTLLHKIRSTNEPQVLASQLQTNAEIRSRNTRRDADLALPRIRTEAGRRRFMYRAVQAYNALPEETRILNIPAFRRAVCEALDSSEA